MEKLIMSTGTNQKVDPSSLQKKSNFFIQKLLSYLKVNV